MVEGVDRDLLRRPEDDRRGDVQRGQDHLRGAPNGGAMRCGRLSRRKAGSVEGFHYSEANKNSGLTWDEATLDTYLTSPKDVVKGTTMAYPGLKDAEKRADLIAYLRTVK